MSKKLKFYNTVTATGHGRIIVQELLCGPEVGEGTWRVFEPKQQGKKQPRRGKGLDPDQEKTCHWSRQGGRFTAKKKRNPKSQFRASPRNRKVAFSRGPVKGEILVPKWHIEAFNSVG